MAHPLQRRLAAVRRKVRFVWIAYGLSAAVSIALIGVLILAGTDYLLRFEDRGMRWIWSLAAFGLAVGAVVRFVVPALRSRLDDVGMAQRIEGRFSGAADHLSSAIEFLDQPADAAAYLTVTDSHPDSPGFDGWMLEQEPSVSMMQHPVYDLRVTGCT